MVRTILIENTSGVTNTWIGQQLVNNETFDIHDFRMSKWANNSTVIADVESGDLKVIKSTGPTVYYTASEGQRVLDGMPSGIAASGSYGELLCSGPTNELVWTPVVGGTIIFFNDGSSNNVWMKVTEGQAQTSNIEPVIMPFDCVIYALTFVNKDDSKGIDLEIYKNGTLLYTWNIVNKIWADKTDGISSVTVSVGDRMSIFLKSIGNTPNDPLVTVHYSFLNGTTGNGGAATGV